MKRLLLLTLLTNVAACGGTQTSASEPQANASHSEQADGSVDSQALEALRASQTPLLLVQQYQSEASQTAERDRALQERQQRAGRPLDQARISAERGLLWDGLRARWYMSLPALFTAQEAEILRRAEQSENPALRNKAAEVRRAVGEAWTETKRRQLAGLDCILIETYGRAALLAIAQQLLDAAILRSRHRLAYLDRHVPRSEMRRCLGEELASAYTDGMFENERGALDCGGTCAGEVTADTVTLLRDRAQRIQACYVEALRRDIRAEGAIRVQLRISPNGVPCDYDLLSTTFKTDAAFDSCVEGMFFAADFPAPASGCADVVVPMRFQREALDDSAGGH